MLLVYVLTILFVICSNESRSILESNDTALEYLNNCECVLDYHCYNETFNTRGIGIMTLRNNVPEIKCTKPSHVCCRANVPVKIDTRLNLSLSGSLPTRNLSNSYYELQKNDLEEVCGKPKPLISVRIFSNPDDISAAIDGEFPWMASIFKRHELKSSFQFKCAGSLISDRVILTAGHCVHGATKKTAEFKILANAKKELSDIGDDPRLERDVEKIIIHPQYYAGAAHNDIALIFLQKSFNESRDLNSVCIAGENSKYDSSRCLAAGWGTGNYSRTAGEKILRKVELPLMDNRKCEEQLRKTRLGNNFELHESFICAGGEQGKDTCKGDGGGPLICPNEERYFTQVGIVSWGVDCAKKNTPGVYTDVKKFSDWILSNLN